MAAAEDDPLRPWLELFVYAPAGLLIEAKRLYPGVVETGRQRVDNQVRLARFVGEFAVRKGRQVAERKIEAWLQPPGASEPLTAPVPSTLVVEGQGLAIADYDALTAAQIVRALADLSPGDVDEIGRYEAVHRGRRTVLGQVARLQAGSS